MDQDQLRHVAELMKKIQASTASDEEKLEVLKELNAEMPAFNQLLQTLLDQSQQRVE